MDSEISLILMMPKCGKWIGFKSQNGKKLTASKSSNRRRKTPNRRNLIPIGRIKVKLLRN